MKIVRINDFNEIHELIGNWDDLVNRSLDRNPFLLLSFIKGWFKEYKIKLKPRFYAVKEEDKVPVIVPMIKTKYNVFNIPYNKLEFYMPQNSCHTFIISDYKLAHKTIKPLIKKAISDNMPVDCIDFKGIPSDSYTCKLLDSIGCRDMNFTKRKAFNEYYIKIPETYDAFRMTLTLS